MAIKKFSPLLAENPLCGIGEYKDVLDLSTGGVTRQIKKLVLTGDETGWEKVIATTATAQYFRLPIGEYNSIIVRNTICTHFQNVPVTTSTTNVGATVTNLTMVSAAVIAVRPTDVEVLTVENFKQWLADEYAAGHPVTIWYVLSTPETETITVPSGLTGTIKGYLTQSGTPTPSTPIYPEANPALVWAPTTYRKYGTETDTITSLPAQIIGDGQPITSCQISGNMIQNGTPTPSSPIYPEECGDLETMGEHAGQYKLPISCGGTTTNVYLGEQSATRRIKKLVLTGEEDWEIITNNNPYFRLVGETSDGAYAIVVCSHYVSPSTSISANNSTEGVRVQSTTVYGYVIVLRTPTWQTDTLSDFKSFLADEYAAGRPVTIWYILADPETTTLNEPIRKIGDYADTVTTTNVPTTGTAEQFDVQTTLKPSEVQLTYHGWHEHEDTKLTQS